jgi:hypothetical protein
MDDPTKFVSKLGMHMETPRDVGDNMANVMRGWFVAPATTRYRFMTACDDYCALRMSSHPGTDWRYTARTTTEETTRRRL